MSFNWINPKEFSIYSLLLMNEFIIYKIVNNKKEDFKINLTKVLLDNPAILWYFKNKAPELAHKFDEIIKVNNSAAKNIKSDNANNFIIDSLDWAIVYVFPEVMEKINYISEWDENHLLEMVDFKNKEILDIGAGTGRLSFSAAKYAKYIYALEPVERLRRHMRLKAKKYKVNNLYVVDGVIEMLPFPCNNFDIIMSGHVVGDNYNSEYMEMYRVIKDGGYIIMCPGEDDRVGEKDEELIKLGFDYTSYKSSTGGVVWKYKKKVKKE